MRGDRSATSSRFHLAANGWFPYHVHPQRDSNPQEAGGSLRRGASPPRIPVPPWGRQLLLLVRGADGLPSHANLRGVWRQSPFPRPCRPGRLHGAFARTAAPPVWGGLQNP